MKTGQDHIAHRGRARSFLAQHKSQVVWWSAHSSTGKKSLICEPHATLAPRALASRKVILKYFSLLSSFSLSLGKLIPSIPFLAIPWAVTGESMRCWVPSPLPFSCFLILWMVYHERAKVTWQRWTADLSGPEGEGGSAQARPLCKRL